MTDTNDNDTDFPGVSVDTSEPEHVSGFYTKGDYPDEVAEQWDNIRAGRIVAVDGTGHPVEELDDVERLLHPAYGMMEIPSSLTGIGPNDLPPVAYTDVGDPGLTDPDGKAPHELSVNPDTGEVIVGGSDD